MSAYEFRECSAANCRFRYPVLVTAQQTQNCPYCGSETRQVSVPLPSENLGTTAASTLLSTNVTTPINSPPLSALLDNIRSIHNVGSMFRTADGAGLAHLYLCGMTATPDHPKLAKAALGADKTVGWSYARNALETAVTLKKAGNQLWAIETIPTAEPLFDVMPLLLTKPAVLVVGNEKAGVDPGILAHCDRVLSLPMSGHKQSLNAAVAFGIAVYHLSFQLSS